jgi:uncharacterized protein (TIGR02246 family)
MTRAPDELVTEFCKLWASPDPERLASYFTEDAVYHNIPMESIQGREAIKEFIAGFTAAWCRGPPAEAGPELRPPVESWCRPVTNN